MATADFPDPGAHICLAASCALRVPGPEVALSKPAGRYSLAPAYEPAFGLWRRTGELS